ncbi:MAG: DegV family protein [Anaerolineae bacterium]|jgi:DegV family protein with EDD domain|nr:DegV family protein [Anaerolineae bacterium]MBT7070231.1 DegV family protein [Anaerolineae bacterium]MBT7324962.1 DegV family protein [Anaerolineae bacterium]
MSKKVAIVTDSTAYIPDALVEEHNLTVLPLEVIWGEETYKDGIDILPQEFYTRLQTAKVMPSTSQVTIPGMQAAFERLVAEDYDVLGVFLSNKLSGTINSAVQGKAAMQSGQEHIHIFDSETTAMAMGFQALTVARAAQDGATIADCLALAEKVRDNTGLYFAVDTLEFLHRGGRIGGAKRLIGSAMKVKPILSIQDGSVASIESVRTKRKAHARVLDIIAEEIGDRGPISIATLQANALEDASALVALAQERLDIKEVVLSQVSPVIGTHVGPGTVGLAYMAGI